MEEEIIINTEVKGADKAEKQLGDLADATNEASESAVNYEGTLVDLAKETEIFGVSLNGLSSGLKNSTAVLKNSVKGLKLFKVALAATGIGLLVVALGSLVAWLKTSQEGMLLIRKATAGFGAVITQLLGTLGKLGGALVKVFKGDFKGALDQAKTAIDGFAEGVRNAVERSNELQDLLRLIEGMTSGIALGVSVLNEEISANKLIIEDTTKSIYARIEAQKENQRLIKAIAEAEADLAEKQLVAAQLRAQESLAASADGQAEQEFIDGINEATQRQIELRTQANERSVEGKVKLNELLKEEKEKRGELLKIDTIRSKQVDNSTKLEVKSHLVIAKSHEEMRARMAELDKQYAVQTASMAFELANSIAQLAGENSAFAKLVAIANTIFNIQQGIAVALTAPTIAQRIIGVAFAATNGLIALNTIRNTAVPTSPSPTDAPTFGDGGLINGSSHGAGGVWINAEGGEAVVNKRSMAIPYVRRQVSYLNQLGGGVPIMADGGVVPSMNNLNPFVNVERAISQARPVLVTDDLRAVQLEELAVKVTSTL